MNTMHTSLMGLMVEDVLESPVQTIPAHTPPREAARALFSHQVGALPVVDRLGRCVGVFTATDVLRWLDRNDRAGGEPAPRIRTCPYQTCSSVCGFEHESICTLEAGACPLQATRPLNAGRHISLCLAPHDVLSDWQQVVEDSPSNAVTDFMQDIVTVEPTALLLDVARMMVDAHIHRVLVLDEERYPVGLVSASDVLAALTCHGLCDSESFVTEDAF